MSPIASLAVTAERRATRLLDAMLRACAEIIFQCQWATATPRRQCESKKVHSVEERGCVGESEWQRWREDGLEYMKASFGEVGGPYQRRGARVNGRLDPNGYSYMTQAKRRDERRSSV